MHCLCWHWTGEEGEESDEGRRDEERGERREGEGIELRSVYIFLPPGLEQVKLIIPLPKLLTSPLPSRYQRKYILIFLARLAHKISIAMPRHPHSTPLNGTYRMAVFETKELDQDQLDELDEPDEPDGPD